MNNPTPSPLHLASKGSNKKWPIWFCPRLVQTSPTLKWNLLLLFGSCSLIYNIFYNHPKDLKFVENSESDTLRGPTRSPRIATSRIAQPHQIRPKGLILGLGMNIYSPMWRPRWQTFRAKSLGRLKKFGMRYSLAQTLNMGHFGLIHWIIDISTIHP